MSYIYEALKKAEDERKQGTVAVRATGRRTLFAGRPPWWLWALIGVLGANVVVLATLAVTLGYRWPGPRVARTEPREATAPAAPVTRVAPAAPAPVMPAAPVAPPVAVAPPVPVAPPAPVAPAARVVSPPAAPAARVAPPAAARPPAVPVAPAPPVAPASPAPRVVTSRRVEPQGNQDQPARSAAATQETRAAGADVRPAESAPPVDPPRVTLQVIVYSEVPAQRMVFINGQRYAEGDSLDAETVLERINSDGAVFKRRGVRFVIAGRRD